MEDSTKSYEGEIENQDVMTGGELDRTSYNITNDENRDDDDFAEDSISPSQTFSQSQSQSQTHSYSLTQSQSPSIHHKHSQSINNQEGFDQELDITRQISVFKHLKKKAENDAQLLLYVVFV